MMPAQRHLGDTTCLPVAVPAHTPKAYFTRSVPIFGDPCLTWLRFADPLLQDGLRSLAVR